MKRNTTLLSAASLATAVGLLAACAKAPEPAAGDPAPAAEPAAPAFTRTPAPAGAAAYIISPKDGETVSSPVKVVFGLTGIGIAPASVQFENTGHHHVLIDTDLPADLNVPLPADATHVHYGKGQTEATLELAPGKHTLQLVLGDYLHIPFDPVIASPKITITVK